MSFNEQRKVDNVPSGAVAARERTCGISQKVADGFVEALCKPEEDVEALVAIHTDDCEVSNVSLSGTLRGHEGLREFWTSYRSTFGEMRSEFRNVFATEEGAALEWTTQGTSNGEDASYNDVSILVDRGLQGSSLHGLLRHPRPRSPSRGLMASREPLILTDPRIDVLRNRCLLLDIYPLA